MTEFDYIKGSVEVAPGTYAWLYPDGGWGWNNPGLVVGQGASLLIDTCFDLKTTQEMLDGFAPLLVEAPLTTLFNTHANGDHYFGNQLIPEGIEIVATDAAKPDMTQEDVEAIESLKHLDGNVGAYARDIFGPFDFTSVKAVGPTRTFSGEVTLDIGGREVVLIELGPAHTPGDAVAWVPDAKVAFAGDILFIGGTPIIWAGPVDNWIRACDRLLDLEAEVYVPGHGPITDRNGVIGARDYLVFVKEAAESRFAAGMTVDEATADIGAHLGRFAELGDGERLVQNVLNIYRSLHPEAETMPQLEVFRRMAELDGYPILRSEEHPL
ncbi:MAG: MBL fold metallo-hydrolase [Pirellulales bacterium]